MLSICIASHFAGGQVWRTVIGSYLGPIFERGSKFPELRLIIREANDLNKLLRVQKSRVLVATLACALMTYFTAAQGETQLTPTSIGRSEGYDDLSPQEKDGIIFERQQLMLALEADTKTLGGIVAGTVSTAKLAETTRSIADSASASMDAFEPVVPGGRSKPSVWSERAQFMEDMQLFARNAEAMAQAGEKGDVNSVVNLMIDALPCKQCHDQFREPKANLSN